MDLPLKIIQLRTQKGFTTNKLAKLAGISQSFMRDIEIGKSQPTLDTLNKICFALGISIGELFAEEKPEFSLALLRLLNSARDLPPKQLEALTQFVEAFTDDATAANNFLQDEELPYHELKPFPEEALLNEGLQEFHRAEGKERPGKKNK